MTRPHPVKKSIGLHWLLSVLLKTTMVLAVCLYYGLGSSFTQFVAWSTMLPEQLAETQSISKAVEQTFDGEHRCPMCKAAAEIRALELSNEQPSDGEKKPATGISKSLVFSTHSPFFHPRPPFLKTSWQIDDWQWMALAHDIPNPPPQV